MLKYIFVLIVSLGFITPAFAAPLPPVSEPACFFDSGCTEALVCETATCEGEIFVMPRSSSIPGVCEYNCTATYDSRGDCISTLKDRCQLSFPTGEARKNCEARIKDFCDCAVDTGCTDVPPGPPSD